MGWSLQDYEYIIRIVGYGFIIAACILCIYVLVSIKTICPMFLGNVEIDSENRQIYAFCKFDKSYNDHALICINEHMVKYRNTTWFEYYPVYDNSVPNNTIPFQRKII